MDAQAQFRLDADPPLGYLALSMPAEGDNRQASRDRCHHAPSERDHDRPYRGGDGEISRPNDRWQTCQKEKEEKRGHRMMPFIHIAAMSKQR
jgi:hypothetical protein